MITSVVEVLLLIVAAPFVLAPLYLAFLAFVAVLPGASARDGRASGDRRFAIIVPAHNEEHRLPRVLESLRNLDYSRKLVSIVVVADNCDDNTAEVARQAGVGVAERHAAERGKGFALAAGLRHATGTFDAVLFLDADCTITPNALHAFNDLLDRGDHVIQAYYTMDTPSGASHAALRRLSLALVHLVRPLAKTRIGGSAGLKGSGMCFSREAIEEVGWWSTGLAEDAEQHVRLLRHGIRVAFARDVLVAGEQPASLRDADNQHRRWEAGRSQVARHEAFGLIAGGIRERSLGMLDAAVELVIPPVSIMLIALVPLVGMGIVLGSAVVSSVAAIGLICLAWYFTAGAILSAERPMDIARALLSVPAYALWKARVYAQSLISPPQSWERTRRDP